MTEEEATNGPEPNDEDENEEENEEGAAVDDGACLFVCYYSRLVVMGVRAAKWNESTTH